MSTANEGSKVDVTPDVSESKLPSLNGHSTSEPPTANGAANGPSSAASPPKSPAQQGDRTTAESLTFNSENKPSEVTPAQAAVSLSTPSAPANIDGSGDSTIQVAANPAPTSTDTLGDKMDLDASQQSQAEPEGTKSNLPHHPVSEPPSLPPIKTDHEMRDATATPLSPSKIARQRDADAIDEPAAKRTKVDEDSSHVDFKLPEAPASGTEGSFAEAPATPTTGSESSITKMQHKFLMKSISSLKRMHDSRFYRNPVDPLALNIPSYFTIIETPMDLGTIEKKLKNHQYASPKALIDDFATMVNNSVKFNGAEHMVSLEGQKLKATFDKQLQNLPKSDEVEEKKPKKLAEKTSAARREPRTSTGSVPAKAASPQNTTFALGPEGLPVIRRDSSNPDRPKRSIHPPKRDLPYSTKPKKKKYQWELKFCQDTLTELMKTKHAAYASPFYYPVDPVALNIPTYHNIIKKPMDMQTIQNKLKTGQYENAKEFENDMNLMLKNCFRFNLEGDPTYACGKELERAFQIQWAKKEEFLDKHEPAPEQTDSSDNESDVEAEGSDEDTAKITALQRQIAEMSRQVEMMTQKKKTPPSSKKAGKSKSSKKDTKKSSGSKKSSKSSKGEKQRFVTYDEKQTISNGISSLPDKKMQEALMIIQNNVPSLKVRLITLFEFTIRILTIF